MSAECAVRVGALDQQAVEREAHAGVVRIARVARGEIGQREPGVAEGQAGEQGAIGAGGVEHRQCQLGFEVRAPSFLSSALASRPAPWSSSNGRSARM